MVGDHARSSLQCVITGQDNLILDRVQNPGFAGFFEKIQIMTDPTTYTGIVTVRQYFAEQISAFLLRFFGKCFDDRL